MFHLPSGTELVEYVGAGATFDVAVVRGSDGARTIAKRVRPSLSHEEAARAALVREAQTLALIQHSAVPRLVRVGTDAAGPFVLESEIPGASLREFLSTWSPRVPTHLALHLAHRAAFLLDSLHRLHAPDEAGGSVELLLVHGDMSPAQLIVTPRVDIAIVDFGAARTCRTPGGDVRGAERGTLPFVAPELCRGETIPTQATDRYALAVILAELLTGARLAHAIDEAALLVEIGDRGHDLAPLASAALDPAVKTALTAQLDRDPGARPRDLTALLDALDRSRL